MCYSTKIQTFSPTKHTLIRSRRTVCNFGKSVLCMSLNYTFLFILVEFCWELEWQRKLHVYALTET